MFISRGIYSTLRLLKGNINFSRVCWLSGTVENNPEALQSQRSDKILAPSLTNLVSG